MKIAVINGGVFGSTGKIISGIIAATKEEYPGAEFFCASPVTDTNRFAEPDFDYEKIGTYSSRRASVLAARITGRNGCFAKGATRRLLKKIREFSPDIIHLHTLHDSFINLPLLFGYLKEAGIHVIWTLHDCWAFTGHCTHFTAAGCEKWKTLCRDCPQYREYPMTLFDSSSATYARKKEWFTGIKDLTVVTPSEWLAERVRASFLSEYPVKAINNGIDLETFRPTASDVLERLGIGGGKMVVLGVSFGWSDKKGLDIFIKLAESLDPSKYAVVLVGTDAATEKILPRSVIAVGRTNDAGELARIYSAADVFVNPSREETFPTVNLEALACGTPVVTSDTGGCPETVGEGCGKTVPSGDAASFLEAAVQTAKEKGLLSPACVGFASNFDKRKKFREYADLYGSIYDRASKSRI